MKLSGSFTIEASLLLPFVILILIGIVETTIYFHDSIVLQTVADDALGQLHAMNEGGCFSSDNEEETVIREFIRTKLDGALLGVKENTVSLTFEKTNYLYYQRLYLQLKAPFWRPMGISIDDLTISVEAKTDQYNPIEVVRLVDFIDDASSRISYMKEIKDYYYLWLEKMKVMLLDEQ